MLEALTRTEAAGYRIEHTVAFERLVTMPRAELLALVLPMESLLQDTPQAAITAEGVDWAQHGRDLGARQLLHPLAAAPALVRLIGPDGRLVGLAAPAKPPALLHPAVVFRYH
jgi:tRNA U55 pseudouridine synthase TruB